MSDCVCEKESECVCYPDPCSLPPPGVQRQQVCAESLLLEAAKQVKVSELEDDILELPEEAPATANQ